MCGKPLHTGVATSVAILPVPSENPQIKKEDTGFLGSVSSGGEKMRHQRFGFLSYLSSLNHIGS
jgi:hypothetical protein